MIIIEKAKDIVSPSEPSFCVCFISPIIQPVPTPIEP